MAMSVPVREAFSPKNIGNFSKIKFDKCWIKGVYLESAIKNGQDVL